MHQNPSLSDESSPTAQQLKDLREKTRRTQAQTAVVLDVGLRQVQRWEAGEQAMPAATWRFLKMSGHRLPVDFTVPAGGITRSWNMERDTPRETIERGDFVHLQPVVGPMIQARVWLDRVHDGLIDDESYGAFVIGFPDHPEAGQELDGFYIGERITFSARNVVHVEQRTPIQHGGTQ
jgi:transcriptional regulator with XRE-family HTH domain